MWIEMEPWEKLLWDSTHTQLEYFDANHNLKLCQVSFRSSGLKIPSLL
jgi:hypothetical protein